MLHKRLQTFALAGPVAASAKNTEQMRELEGSGGMPPGKLFFYCAKCCKLGHFFFFCPEGLWWGAMALGAAYEGH